ncbi:MAG TPA: response regulator [Candidatus Acidoferrum sp.]|nr:response regulator [Candidatus Acidoferrum sp.]
MKRALVVDDQPEVCELLTKALQSEGLETLTLHASADAPEFLTESKFDVVFLDLHMPNLDGIDLLRHIRKSLNNQTTPVILLSDDQRPSALSVAFDAGASFFLYKPLDKERVLKILRAAQSALDYRHRQTRRVELRAPVRLRWGAEMIQGETINMSLSGVLLKASSAIPVGSPVNLSLFLFPHAKPVISEGSVVRIEHDNRMGIRLNNLTMQESMRLQEFLLPLIPVE